MKHKLITYGKGERVWGECSCEEPVRGRMWAWLGTYELPRGRYTRMRAAWVQHVATYQPYNDESQPN